MKIHIAPEYIMNPTHPITIALVGCGGTGSQVLTCLARIDHCLKTLNHPGLHVCAFDPDHVSPANIGRQLFSKADAGLNKAVVLVSRINAFFGTAWDAIPEKFDKENGRSCNIIISCVDTLTSRQELSDCLFDYKNRYYTGTPYLKPYYWFDFGNGKTTGQVVLGTIGNIPQPESKEYETVSELPVFTDRFNMDEINEDDSGPSCSLGEALEKQDLFINSALAQMGCNLLWKLVKEGVLYLAGFYMDIGGFNCNPIAL